MEQNNHVLNLAKQVKKEHFIKIVLWAVGTFLTLLWLVFTITTSISMGDKYINEKLIDGASSWAQIEQYNHGSYRWVQNMDGTYKVYQYTKLVDWNPLCLTYDKTLTGYYLLILLAPVGYLGIIFIIAYLKNMITPQAIKKTVRKALQFNYLKQKDVDYVINEIDFNIGIKSKPKQEHEQEPKEQIGE